MATNLQSAIKAELDKYAEPIGQAIGEMAKEVLSDCKAQIAALETKVARLEAELRGADDNAC
jgi:hypothetical protein